MFETEVKDVTIYKHCSNCHSVATKEVTTRELPPRLITNYYCPMCFEEWKKEQGTRENMIQWTREKFTKAGMTEEEEVEEKIKMIFKTK